MNPQIRIRKKHLRIRNTAYPTLFNRKKFKEFGSYMGIKETKSQTVLDPESVGSGNFCLVGFGWILKVP
jgi:hypothetical protein